MRSAGARSVEQTDEIRQAPRLAHFILHHLNIKMTWLLKLLPGESWICALLSDLACSSLEKELWRDFLILNVYDLVH
jgi:hypothetical protein